MMKNSRWLNGPAFLWKEESSGPAIIDASTLKDSDPEVRKESRIYITVAVQDSRESLIHHYSSWWKLKRAFAFMLRYKTFLQSNVCKRKTDGAHKSASPLTSTEDAVGKITTRELQSAEEEIVLQVQKATFPKVFEALSNISPGASERLMKETIQKVGTSIFKLNPKLRSGLLFVDGRLESTPVDENLKCPYVLPNHHHMTELIIQHNHRSMGHMGQESVLHL